MLSLLSRAARTRGSCHCPQCLPTLQRTAGRAGTNASVLRPQYWTSSTLWYSGIFAAAATCDAGAKIQRRQQWNEAIDEVKKDLWQASRAEDWKDTHRKIDLDEQPALDDQEGEGYDEWQTIAAEDAQSDASVRASTEIAEDFDSELAQNLDSSSRRTHVPSWPTTTALPPVRHHLPSQSIYTYRFRKQTADANRWASKKLSRVELSMDMLQLRFFLWLHHHGVVEHVARVMPVPYAEAMMQYPGSLKRAFAQKKADFDRLLHTHKDDSGQFHFSRSLGDIALCHYAESQDDTFREEQRELQREVDVLLSDDVVTRDHGEPHPKQFLRIADVFCRLSMSSVPPNIDIYNTLIHRLRKLGHYRLTENAISAVLNSKIRPNEVTLATVLNHYTDRNNVHRFTDWMRLIRGDRGGLMEPAPWLIRAPWLGKSKADLGRIVHRRDKPDRLIQLPYPTPLVFDAVVKGVLHFGGFGEALEICKTMGDEGWGLDMRGFGMLLNDCAVRSDWNSGLAVWNEILKLQKKSTLRIDGLKTTEIIMTPLFADMLRLCRRCDKRQAFVAVWDQAKATHPTLIKHIMSMINADNAADRQQASRVEKSEEQPTPDNLAPSRAESDGTWPSRRAALNALAELRAQHTSEVADANSQQEYLALQADVDFLRQMENPNATEKPKVRSLAELAKSAYSLIASHPETLEKRVSATHREEFPARSDGEPPVSYTELAKNAYHLIADHPSTLARRARTPGISTTDPWRSSHVVDNNSQDTLTQPDSSEQGLDESAADSNDQLSGGPEPITYSSLARNAYRLVADPPSTLERRKPDISKVGTGKGQTPLNSTPANAAGRDQSNSVDVEQSSAPKGDR
ncbi:hypothetical protein CKM354_000452000 [Cercospora kikuchii]|uniref:Pentatricopeptide repeat domain-containing protein n=1 Tax=Cercospora kikuchii TaxID=84275 RepID=A0A9P3FBE4_9PEZI|nr:uncharacterized protein CKM354_000452000 [Cercospora kikuchii]GIZ41206.1 hypothetical protein CKM354_000452000 [Cercospora kikuchii]